MPEKNIIVTDSAVIEGASKETTIYFRVMGRKGSNLKLFIFDTI